MNLICNVKSEFRKMDTSSILRIHTLKTPSYHSKQKELSQEVERQNRNDDIGAPIWEKQCSSRQ